MEIALHEPIVQTKQAARRAQKRARRRSANAVEAVRGVDLHEPAQAAKKVAKRAAKRTAKRAAASATVAAGRATRNRRRVVRVGAGALVAGLVVAVIVIVVRRLLAPPAPEVVGTDRSEWAAATVGAGVPNPLGTQQSDGTEPGATQGSVAAAGE